jgi:hypothetical protein
MEDSINNVEDQPKPAEDSAAAQAAFQDQVNGLGQQLMRKLQLNGNQFNGLELELRVFILVEQVNLLTKILQAAIPGAAELYSDARLTEQMTRQVALMTKTMSDELAKAPRIALAGAPPTRLNGSKHN